MIARLVELAPDALADVREHGMREAQGGAEDVQQRLDRPLDLSYRKTPLDELLLELGKRIGITVHFQPGVLRNVDARERNVELVQRGISARQALDCEARAVIDVDDDRRAARLVDEVDAADMA